MRKKIGYGFFFNQCKKANRVKHLNIGNRVDSGFRGKQIFMQLLSIIVGLRMHNPLAIECVSCRAIQLIL